MEKWVPVKGLLPMNSYSLVIPVVTPEMCLDVGATTIHRARTQNVNGDKKHSPCACQPLFFFSFLNKSERECHVERLSRGREAVPSEEEKTKIAARQAFLMSF